MTYAAAVCAAVMGAVMVYRMRWWKDFPESRLFTMTSGAISVSYILAVPPVVERLNSISINITGSAVALLASALFGSVSFSAMAAAAFEILTGTRHLGRYVGMAWSAAAAVFVGCWIAGDARRSETLNSFTAQDVPAKVFGITYAVLMILTALATLVATWQALQRKDIRPRLRRATGGLFVAAVCMTGLSVSLLLNALVLHLSAEGAEIIEQIWWLPITIAVAVAAL
ncbi:hypothetical protein [Nocardia sp. NPDC052566]|uniref:hypothetical protein n=1 Tax=Nocardia sp. NPDC052566 TaxID=3364330 RepID=UPI0037C64668